jgi:carboxypeptidase C (cathepsin A)
MLFIDQPLNVGFSFSGNRTGKAQVSTAEEAGQHLLNFMHNFYNEWPLLRQNPLYITGESFAGHYIPAFAQNILTN